MFSIYYWDFDGIYVADATLSGRNERSGNGGNFSKVDGGWAGHSSPHLAASSARRGQSSGQPLRGAMHLSDQHVMEPVFKNASAAHIGSLFLVVNRCQAVMCAFTAKALRSWRNLPPSLDPPLFIEVPVDRITDFGCS